ncbi:MAG: hypothetical protein N2512_11015 [Armatimonadetes bacterium]|nr:hypothetical protein [Armatimonadota bacterium]
MAAAWQPQPADRWPRWLHFGCIGCSLAAAAAVVGVALYVAVAVHQHIQQGREPVDSFVRQPLNAFRSGCIGVVRAAGYDVSHAAVLPDGRILALGSWVPSIPGLFAQALENFGDPEQAAAEMVRRFGPHLLLLTAGQMPRAIPLPGSDDEMRTVEEFCVDSTGQRVAARLSLTSTFESADQGHAAVEIWSLDLPTGQWRQVTVLPVDSQLSLIGWLRSGRSLAAMIGRQGLQETQLCLVGLDGTIRRVATLPQPLRYPRILADGRLIGLKYWGDLDAHGAEGLLYLIDLAMGKVIRRPITFIPAVQPGPLASDEELILGYERLGALSRTASRVRWITWPVQRVYSAKARPDGRWVLASISHDTGKSKPDWLMAVHLSDGRLKPVAEGKFTVLAAAPDGRSFWVSTRGQGSAMAGEQNAQVLEVFLDWDALSRAASDVSY